MSLAMTLMAKVSAEGGWCGVVGVPSFGYLAASELGIRLDQLALVPAPGGVWSEATAALLTGLDLVVVQPPGPVSGALARRLAARARRYRCTLVTLGSVWEGTDVRVAAIDQAWEGLHTGWGRLSARKIRIVASTRLGQNIEMWLPAADGGIRLADVGLQTSDVSAGEPESSRVVASSLSASAS
jgi:hypothetical protein